MISNTTSRQNMAHSLPAPVKPRPLSQAILALALGLVMLVVLVLLVLGVVVLFGFAALAVDGGMVYSDRRHAQMGSDASSLAGGGAAAVGREWINV